MSTILQLNGAGQVTIPAAIRKQLGIGPGDPVQVTVGEQGMLLQPVIVTPKSFAEIDAVFDEVTAEYGEAIERLADL